MSNNKWLIPYHLLSSGQRIVIYGAGSVGCFIFNKLSLETNYSIIGIVDGYLCDHTEEYKSINIHDIKWLLNQTYDKIIIAIADRKKAYSAMLNLQQFGIPFNKMLWQNYYPHLQNEHEYSLSSTIEKKLPHIEYFEKHTSVFPDMSNTIWVCWLQGFENAPKLVSKCYKRLLQMSNSHPVIAIDLNNIKKYIDIPDYILDKYSRKLISNTHFADIIRIMLLAKYGGLWIDSTCWFTDKVPEYYFKYPFFVFQSPFVFYQGPRIASNWLIGSSPNNDLILCLEYYLLDWWKHNNSPTDYFLMHYLMTHAIFKNLDTFKIWEKLDYYDNITPHLLQHEYTTKYTKERYDYICQKSPIHKLSYKYNYVIENSMLDYILKELI